MDKRKYIIAIFWLLILGQIICVTLIEVFVNLNVINTIDLTAWRFSIIGFVALSMVFLPLLIYINKNEDIKNKKTELNNITNAYAKIFQDLQGEIYLVNKNNKIVWLSDEAKKRIKNKYSLVNASLVHEKFKQANLSPNRKHFFQDENGEYEVVFYKELNTYFCLNITNKMKLEREVFNDKEVMGFLEVRSINENNPLNFNAIKNKFIERIKNWAHQYKIVITNIGSLNFIIYMRNSSFLQMKNEEFSVVKQLDKLLKLTDKDYIIQLSLATSGSNTLINAELARKGLVEVRSKKNNSLIIIQDAELNSLEVIDVKLNGLLNNVKETSVIPEGFSYQTYETIKKEREDIPISIKLSSPNDEKSFDENNNSLGFKKAIETNESAISKKDPPEWLKKALEKAKSSKGIIKKKTPLQRDGRFKYSLLGEIEKMSKIICFFPNANNKDEFFIALLFYLIIKKLKLNYYVYSGIPFTIHHSSKNKLKEFYVLNFQKTIVDAFTLKRMEKANTFYLIFKNNSLNKDFMNTTATHKVAYINPSTTKPILEILFNNIKNELDFLEFKDNELKVLIFFAKKEKDAGKLFVDLFTKMLQKKNH